MRLHDYAASGNCYKVRLLLALLGRAYERVPVDIFAGDTLTDAYGALNPLRETPVLELDSGEVDRAVQRDPLVPGEGTPFLPADALAQARVLQWLAFEQERVMGGIGGPRFRRLTGRPEIPGRLDVGAEALAVLEDAPGAAATGWSATAPTIADVSVFGYAHVAARGGPRAGRARPRVVRPHPGAPRLRRRPGALRRERAPGRGPLDLRLT